MSLGKIWMLDGLVYTYCIKLVWKNLPRINTLLRTVVNYRCKKFYNFGPWSQHSKRDVLLSSAPSSSAETPAVNVIKLFYRFFTEEIS
jgi:hypothetical protein